MNSVKLSKASGLFLLRTIYALLVLSATCGRLAAADYYVDTANPGASDSNPGTAAQPWKTITKANQILSAGDTVYIKQGSYTTFVAPSRSGTATSPITYRNYSNDLVTVQNASYGVHLDGKSWIVVQGITFTHLDSMMILENSSNHNTISNCSFTVMRNQVSYYGSRIWLLSSYNHVTNCVFSTWGQCSGGLASGGVFEIGFDDGDSTYPGNYNLVENCTMFHAGHHVLGVNGNHNVIRNNYLYNDAWTAGRGARALSTNGYAAYCNLNLIENNRIGYSYVPCDTFGIPVAQIASEWNIVRQNYFFFSNLSAIQFSTTDNYHSGPNHNYVYNNTFMHNGWQTDNGQDDPARCQIGFMNWSSMFTVKFNVIKNNLFYQAPTPVGGGPTRVFGYNGPASPTDQTFANNYNGDVSGDPLFVNATSTPGDPTDVSYPNLSLRTNSPAINAGGPLTTITSASGSGTSFVVADAAYFMDGWGIVQGDQIQLQGSTQRARITGINYATKVVSVDTSLTWTQNQGVALPYLGSGPDAGAFEYSTATPTPSSTPGPTATGTPAPTATPVFTPTPTPAPTSTPTATPLGLSFDSPEGVITSPFVVSNNSVSQPILTIDPTQGGRALYTFNVPTSGDYYLSAMMNCPDEGSNSFFVNIDGEPAAAMAWSIPVTSGFEVRVASWAPSTTPKFWTLTAGTHQLIVRGREANAILGHITLGTAPRAPEGLRVIP